MEEEKDMDKAVKGFLIGIGVIFAVVFIGTLLGAAFSL